MTSLDLARDERRQRADEALERSMDARLDAVLLGTADVSPAAREKLKGILKRLARQAHPFTQCMSDLAEHKPDWSDDRRKKTCNVLKALSGRGDSSSKTNAAHLGRLGACLSLDDDVVTLLDDVDEDALAEYEWARSQSENFAAVTANTRSKMKRSDFVFPKHKRYPIHDLAHARNALARASGKPEEAAVKAAVYKRYPELKPKGAS